MFLRGSIPGPSKSDPLRHTKQIENKLLSLGHRPRESGCLSFWDLELIPSTPGPEKSRGPIDSVGPKIGVTFNSHSVRLEVEPGPIQATALLSTIFRGHEKLAARVMGHRADATAATSETPFALDAHQRPRTIANFLIVPWPTQKIVPAELQPSGPAFAAGIRPGMLQAFANHRAVDGAGASIGITDHSGNGRAGLGKHDLRRTKVITASPPLAVD